MPESTQFTTDDFGPYFTLADHDAPGSWVSVADLLSIPAILEERIEFARGSYQGVGTTPAEIRAVASTAALGLFARIISPAIGARLLARPTLPPDPEAVLLHFTTSGPVPMKSGRPAAQADPTSFINDLLLPLSTTFRRSFGVSTKVLLGNIAAAVYGACQVVSTARPDLGPAAEELRRELLSLPELVGTATLSGPFIRNSCCQIYRLPMDYICANCILVNANTSISSRRGTDVANSPEFIQRWKKKHRLT